MVLVQEEGKTPDNKPIFLQIAVVHPVGADTFKECLVLEKGHVGVTK